MGAPPGQHPHLFPLKGCSLIPPAFGWANEMCYGDGTSGYICHEVSGDPDLGLNGSADYVVYKDDMLSGTADGSFGDNLVTKEGLDYAGCFNSWVALPNGRHDTNCDYKNVAHNELPGLTSPRAYALQVFNSWASATAQQEGICAKSIVGSWVDSVEPSDVVIDCLLG